MFVKYVLLHIHGSLPTRVRFLHSWAAYQHIFTHVHTYHPFTLMCIHISTSTFIRVPMCIHMCIDTHTQIHTYIYLHTEYPYVFMYPHAYICICTNMHSYIHLHISTDKIHPHFTDMDTQTCICLRARMHKYVCVHKYKYVCVHTDTDVIHPRFTYSDVPRCICLCVRMHGYVYVPPHSDTIQKESPVRYRQPQGSHSEKSAVCCSVSQCVAVCRKVLIMQSQQCVAVCRSVL